MTAYLYLFCQHYVEQKPL